MWPSRKSVMFKILETINTLSEECFEGRVPVTEIYLQIKDSSRESIRVMLSQLKGNGFLETPMRGMYVLSKKGKKRLAQGDEENSSGG